MDSEMRARSEWVDEGLDGLRKEIEGHFSRQSKELGDLQKEVEQLTRPPSIFARWGLASLPQASLNSWERKLSSTSPSAPPTGLSWTDGRIADLQSHVRNASTDASEEVAGIKARIAESDKEASRHRYKRQTLLGCLGLMTLALGPLIVKAAIILLA
jgi:hypothetical protein